MNTSINGIVFEKPTEFIIATNEVAFQDPGEEKHKEDLIINSPVAITASNKEEEYIGHLAAIIESSEDAIISKSLQGIVKSWNKSAEKMFGYTPTEIIGKNICLIIPPEYLNEEKEILKRIRNNESINHFETLRLRKNGDHLYVSLTVSPIKDSKGNIIGISKIARDITSQKKADAELNYANKGLVFQNKEKEKQATQLNIANNELAFQHEEKRNRAAELLIANNELTFQNGEKEKRATELIIADKEIIERTEQLEAANKELEAFSYSVSHDLRAPLRAIHGYTKMLKEVYAGKLDAEGNRLVNNIVNNAKKMGQLIDDLLSFSRIGRSELVKREILMHNMVMNLSGELKDEQPNRVIEFTIKHLFNAQADNIAIRQVWLNLISNAIKYTKHKEEAIIEIGSEINGDEIVYHVKDNGAGFDMRYVNKLFGVFQRLHSDEEFEGTGVGLALVQRIIFKHGGRVWGEGKVNEGATFYFTLNKPS